MFATAGSTRVRSTLARIAIAGLILIGTVIAAGPGSAQTPEPTAAPSSVGWYYPEVTPYEPIPLNPWYPWYRPYYSWYRPGWFGSS